MVRSMTGYGRGECLLFDRKVSVEIKSVNHRYNDLAIKMPRILNAYEDNVRKLLSRDILRGKTDVYISIESFSRDDIKINLNEALSDAYVEQLTKLKARYNLSEDISLTLISRFPDIITVEKSVDNEKASEQIWQTLRQALNTAAANFIDMRQKEGELLKQDLLQKSESIISSIQKLREYAPKILTEYREKLSKRMKEILEDTDIDEARILTEAAFMADRSCIDEELTRLISHFEQFSLILSESGAIGRKLDFLVQEMNREVNTIGSKSNDISVTKIVVDLKSEVEKIREQVQNIE